MGKKNSKTDSGLQHEQGHFDITEIYSRKLRKKLSDYTFKKKSLKANFMKFYNGNAALLDAEHDLYDKETDHHRIEEKQKEWDKKIAEQLKELEAYKETNLTLKVK